MVVVGGSDGTQSLVTSEIFDFENNTWGVGPSLIAPRANLSVVTIDNRLFAVGGFSGKKFLSTIEWLDHDDMEWFGHAPKQSENGLVKEKEEGAHNFTACTNGEEKGDAHEAVKVVENLDRSQVVELDGSSSTSDRQANGDTEFKEAS